MTNGVQGWSVSDVCAWLGSIGLGHVHQTFYENRVDGKTLLDLSKEDIKSELKVQGLGDRKAIFQAIQDLKTSTNPPKPTCSYSYTAPASKEPQPVPMTKALPRPEMRPLDISPVKPVPVGTSPRAIAGIAAGHARENGSGAPIERRNSTGSAPTTPRSSLKQSTPGQSPGTSPRRRVSIGGTTEIPPGASPPKPSSSPPAPRPASVGTIHRMKMGAGWKLSTEGPSDTCVIPVDADNRPFRASSTPVISIPLKTDKNRPFDIRDDGDIG